MSQLQVLYDYNETAYQAQGLGAQRRYPNEEFCRFMGRNYFRTPKPERKNINILELGCGSGANLWMVAKEGFEAHGIDLSPSAIDLAHQMLASYGQTASLQVASMTDLPYEDGTFDCVFDVFSTYCLNDSQYEQTVQEASRVLKKGGKFFTYTPGQGSDAWKNFAPSKKLDKNTLDGISRDTSPYCPSPYPFRFMAEDGLKETLESHGLKMTYFEKIGRTYRSGQEYFEFVVAEAVK